ncbi:MAG: polysaccharide deacetylase family protein [Candidatus Accumulibacter sp.]|nr:polysaccharide deacetylase family protein [Accumulibacter sp.]
MILKTLVHGLSPGGKRGRLSILIFHRVLPQPDPLLPSIPDAAQFARTLDWLRTWFNVLPLDQAIALLQDDSLPPRAAAITFDDGYADNCTVAMPILQGRRLTATFFVATAYLDGGRMWNDTVIEAVRRCRQATLDLSDEGLGVHDLQSAAAIARAIERILDGVKYRDPEHRLTLVDYVATTAGGRLPSDLMLTSDQLRTMRKAGMGIGAHTATHPILAGLAAAEVRREVGDSKRFLESLLQQRITLFAYPNGKPDVDYRAADAEIVRSLGFDGAVTTAWGAADSRSDVMQLPRFTPWDRTRLRFGARLVNNLWPNARLRSGQFAH